MKKRSLAVKLTIVLLVSALIPMLIFGAVSIWTSRRSAYKMIANGNLHVAVRAAAEIELYVSNAVNIVEGLVSNINNTRLSREQKEIVLGNLLIKFRGLIKHIYITNARGIQEVTSDPEKPLAARSDAPAFVAALRGEVYKSDIYISRNGMPEMVIGAPIMDSGRFDGAAVARINLLSIWHMVDSIKIGEKGVTYVVSKQGYLVAHGDQESKLRIFKQENLGGIRIVKQTLAGESGEEVYVNSRGVEMLAVSAPASSLGWGVFIEQPTAEAYKPAFQLTLQLAGLVVFFLLIAANVGWRGGKRYVLKPISLIIEMTKEIADGNFMVKSKIQTGDEFAKVGDSINAMGGRLLALQEDVLRKERQALVGRIASGLIHDLSHPVDMIATHSRLIQERYDDKEYRDTFRTVVDKEFANIKQFLNGLREHIKPRELVFINLDINSLINGVIQSHRGNMDEAGISLTADLPAGELMVSADTFSLVRVFNNLMVNAAQAIQEKEKMIHREEPMHKRIRISAGLNDSGQRVVIEVEDTGTGIPPEKVNGIFDDYTTTKNKGLGLGLATCKKTILEHKGEIVVRSTLGQGTRFSVFLSIRHSKKNKPPTCLSFAPSSALH